MASLLRLVGARTVATVATRQGIRALSGSSALKETAMFCQQCEQTENATGCTTVGVCGKTPETAALQDYLVREIKGLSQLADLSRKNGLAVSDTINDFTLRGLFSTMTNVNFDEARFRQEYIPQAQTYRQELTTALEANQVDIGSLSGTPATDPFSTANLDAFLGAEPEVLARRQALGPEVAGVQELIMYGAKGLSAYASHARAVGQTDDAVYAGLHEVLAQISSNQPEATDLGSLLGAALRVGELNLRVMQMLDAGHNEYFGTPEPTEVRTAPLPGKSILVSGHDLHDLESLLQQVEGTDINVYTHGEMLPAHSYPGLKKYKNLAGHYGGPWQLQKFEFHQFPGPIVMTTNCIIEPRKSYKNRIHTMNEVGWSGVGHVASGSDGRKDFSAVIAQASEEKGFVDGKIKDAASKPITVGFGHATILSVADKVIEGVKAGHIDRVFVIGGCDGSEGERNYYKELALATPDSSLILTLGCAKYRFNRFDFGTVPNVGLPRLLDMGQCNDAYGAVVVASALADAFGCGVNDLPLSFAVSWLEQKAVAVLLTLLHLGIKDIALGPNMPAFVGPEVGALLHEKFGLRASDVNSVTEELETYARQAQA